VGSGDDDAAGDHTRAGKTHQEIHPGQHPKIKDCVAEGISREEIAKSLDVTIQSRVHGWGFLRIPKMFERRRRVEIRFYLPNQQPMIGHIGPKPQYLRFQIILEHNAMRCETDVPSRASTSCASELEASEQNLFR
jgi:hypothetical protein